MISPKSNKIIQNLDPGIYDRWEPFFEIVHLSAGEFIYEPERAPLTHIYFPLTCVVSWIYLLENGATTEIAMIGCEGFVGMHMLLGVESTQYRALVQQSGDALRVPIGVVRASESDHRPLRVLLSRFMMALITQMAQDAVCSRKHTVEQQLCRYLLLSDDRTHSREIQITHRMLADFLGVRREAIALAAKRLFNDQVIHYKRGRILILDREKVERRSCECYGVIRGEYDRLLAMAS